MAWIHWVVKNLARNRLRTVLTLGSVAASMLLLAILSAAYRFLNAPPSGPGGTHLILVVSSRTSMAMSMPPSYRNRIAAVPGVAAVSPFGYFGTNYGPEDDFIPALAFDPATVFDFFNDWQIPLSEKQAFIREKTALIAARKLAAKYGWKLGDHIHLTSPMDSNLSLSFVVRGVFDSKDDGAGSTVVFHWDYLHNALGRTNRAEQFWVMSQSAGDVPRLTKSIDAEFRNAPVETRTDTLKQVMLNFLSLPGNVKLMLMVISAAMVFAVMLVVANTMAMSIRERTAEFATLRAIGFHRRRMIGLLTCESVIMGLTGAGLGCAAAWEVCHVISKFAIGGAMPVRIAVDAHKAALVVVVALGISLVTTLIPAYRSSRLSIAEALRFLG
jgi:putative ABC transport system permease protein